MACLGPHTTGPGHAQAETSRAGLDRPRAGGTGPDGVADPARHHVPYLRELNPLTGAIIRASKITAVRYERERPGELVHMDVKKIGRIPGGGGG